MLDSLINEEELSAFSGRNSKRHYWQYLTIIGIFLALPVAQFTIFQESYDDTICYYNNKCKKPWGDIDAFNNIVSNILYIIFGFTFIITVRFSKSSVSGCGIHRDHSLYYCMGICLIFIGVFSALYHVCPSPLNFQFDTLYMYMSGAITFLAIYHKRHVDKIPSAFKTYLFLAFIYYLSTISLLKYKSGVGMWMWFAADLIIIYVLIHGTINLYFATDWPFGLDLFKRIGETFKDWRYLNKPKIILVIVVNLFTISMILYATFSNANIFTNWFLSLFVINMTIYFIYYTIQKVLHEEHIYWYIWVLMFVVLISLGTALIFFTHGVTNKFLSHEESNKMNEPCILFNYFDYHDVWHMLSAIGLYLFINIIYFIDNDLSDTARAVIPVF